MPNQFTSRVAAPEAKLADAVDRLASQPAPVGGLAQFSAASAQQFEELASLFGRRADRQAQIEGQRAGRDAALQPGFAPSRADTMRGRAFDQAGISAYSDLLEARMRRDMADAADRHREDPKALAGALDGLREAYEKDAVFDEIRPQFRAQFEQLRLPYERQAASAHETRTRETAQANWIERQNAASTTVARIAAGDPDRPEAAAALADERARQLAAVDEAEAAKALSPAAAAKARAAIRNEHVETIERHRAARLPPAEVAARREELRKDFAAGKLDVDADGFERVDGALRAIESQRRTAGDTEAGLVKLAIKDAEKRLVAGNPLSPADLAALTRRAEAVDGGDVAMARYEARALVVSQMQGRRPDEQAALATSARAAARASGAARDALIADMAEEFTADSRQQLAADPFGYAVTRGLVQSVPPLDPTAAPDQLAASLASRGVQARAIAGQLGRAPRFLRPDEAASLKAVMADGGDRALQVAGAIVRGAGDDAPRVLAELGDVAPVMAHAGQLLAAGGSIEAARDVLDHERLRKESGGKMPSIAEADAGKLRTDEVGDAWQWRGEEQARVFAAARAIAETRMARRGIQPGTNEAAEIYKDAVQDASGATRRNGVRYGGVAAYKGASAGWFSGGAKVVVPPGINGDKLPSVIGQINLEDLSGLPVKPAVLDANLLRQIGRARPVFVGGGYAMALGDPASGDPKYLPGSDGKPFILPFAVVRKAARRIAGALDE